MAEADALQQALLDAQNADGGWGYHNGSSWTEPTALALLALGAADGRDPACARGQKWLLRSQRPDGGWAPQPAVDQSTWVTSLATLALPDTDSAMASQQRGISWLLGQILPEDPPLARVLRRFRGISPDPRPPGGSPWFPGTAAWTSPTAASILALSHYADKNNDLQLRARVRQSQEFILSRRCRDGGWNHGGSTYRSENADSYPETTGMALLALRGVDPSELMFPLERAAEFARSPRSVEALSWLQLALLAHGRDHRAAKTDLPCRTTSDVSLRLIALTGDSNSNKLLRA